MGTFLTICQDTVLDVGIAEDGATPTAVTGQVGELLRVVRGVRQGWVDIQNKYDNWRWMRVGFTVPTVSGTAAYAYTSAIDALTASNITRFARWWADNEDDWIKCYLTSDGVGVEYRLAFLPWESFRKIYRIGTQNNGKPAHVTIDPQNNLVIGPTPDAIYTISGDYQRSAQILAADDDVPELPSRFHELLQYEAMERNGYFESAQEVITRAQRMRSKLTHELERDQLPPPQLGVPLA